MQLVVFIKGNNKYSVEDKKGRTLYNIKKKGFGNNNKLFLLNSSNYHLYTLIGSGMDSLSYTIEHNDSNFMSVICKSKFLAPMIIETVYHINWSAKTDVILKSCQRRNRKVLSKLMFPLQRSCSMKSI